MSCGPQTNKLLINVIVDTVGIVGEYALIDNDSIRFLVEGANVPNTFIIRMRLKGQSTWEDIKTLTSNASEVLKTDTYDFMQIESTVLDGSVIKLIASGFKDGE